MSDYDTLDGNIPAAMELGMVLATKAPNLQKSIGELTNEIDEVKRQLRELADGETKKYTVAGLGEVNISKPKAGKTSTKLKLAEDKINQLPELKEKLIAKGILILETNTSPASVAAVTIKPNA